MAKNDARKPTVHYQELLNQTAASVRQKYPKLEISDSAVKHIINEFFDIAFFEYLAKGVDVSLSSYIGKFKSKFKPPRKAINPKTRESVDVPERTSVSLRSLRRQMQKSILIGMGLLINNN